MKKILKRLTATICVLLALITVFVVVGCSGANFDKGEYAPEGGYDVAADAAPGYVRPAAPVPDGDASGDASYAPSEGGVSGDFVAPGDDYGGGTGSAKPGVIAKQLTAAEWSDALNYDFWLGLFSNNIGDEDDNQSHSGIFHRYIEATRGLDSFYMHEVSVTCGGDPIAGAEVKLYNDNEVVFSAVSDSAGKAYVFGNGTHVEAASGGFSASADIAEGVTNIDLTHFEARESELEIMLVVDTTGSMRDELSFLCNELAGVVTRVSADLQCNIRLGLLFYRDDGDEYVTRKFDFVDVTAQGGLYTVVSNIEAQRSSGGGDYPEAVDTALAEAVAADWHTNSKTKLLFQVLDAPYHDAPHYQSKFANAVTSAAQKGIRIIPVAASGLDTLGQYIMRSAALLTGGTYTFLTDDSGIGDSHEMPAVGKHTVEYLSDLMVRLIKGYYTGTFEEPVLWTQSESVI